MTNEELERAVERLNGDLLYAGEAKLAVTRTPDLRAILSERAELLAAVERMRAGLESIAAYYPPGHRIEELARAAILKATATEQGERG